MPDTFQPSPGGPHSFSERDLDSLLAGKTTDIPMALRPVSDTLSALRAGPSPRELRDEAAARARFRAPWPEARAPWPEVPAQRASRRPPRGWFAGLVATAAVIVIGATITYTGHLPASAQRLAHDVIAAPAPSRGGASASPSDGPQTASAQPAPSARPSGSAMPSEVLPSPGDPGRSGLCEAFGEAWRHSRPDQGAWWQTPLYDRLSTAAGGPQQVFGYCQPIWERQFPGQYPDSPSSPPYFPRQGNNGGPGAGQNQDQRPGNPPRDNGRQNGDNTPAGSPTAASPAPTGSPSVPSGNVSPSRRDAGLRKTTPRSEHRGSEHTPSRTRPVHPR